MESDRITWHLKALHREVKQLREVAFEESIACLRHVSHLKGCLDLEQDWYELFIELSILHDVCCQGGRLKELNDLGHKVTDIHYALVGRFKE